MPPLELLIKPSSSMCNLQCAYCFYRDVAQNREKQNYGFMKIETLENVIKKALTCAEGFCSFGFQGGEPTLIGIDFYQSVVELQKKYNKNGVKIYNSIQTNGYQLNEQWADFFHRNDFLIGLSLDGRKKTHDRFRRNAKGEGTFAEIMAVTNLFEKYHVEYNILTVVNAMTARRVPEIYEFYQRKGFEYLQFIPCLDPFEEQSNLPEYYLDAVTYGEFLIQLFDLWYQDYIKERVVHIRDFENYIQILAGYPSEACSMRGICSIQNVIEADGSVYPCDFYVLDSYRLGNLNDCDFEDIRQSNNAKKFIEESRKPASKCTSCKYYALCRGNCRRNRILTDQEGGDLNKFCNSYEMFFDSALERMLEIAERIRRG